MRIIDWSSDVCSSDLDTMKNQRIYIDEVEEKFGVGPHRVGDVLALMGDSADNVPGIRGIGPKTASKLVAEHGSLEAALDSAADMKPSKLKERLIEGRGEAEMSRVLVALKEDRSEEHTSELQSLMRISYAVF